MPTSASEVRHAHAGVVPVKLRPRARAHAASAANGGTATVMSTTPVNVPTQPCQPLITLPPRPSIYVVDVRNGLYVLAYIGRHAREVARIRFLEGNSTLGDAARLDRCAC